MATNKSFRDFVLDQLSSLPVTVKPMMGEYLVYYDKKLIGGFFDGRFLVKKTKETEKYTMEEVVPYPNAKPMYSVDVDDREALAEVVRLTYQGLNKNNEKS